MQNACRIAERFKGFEKLLNLRGKMTKITKKQELTEMERVLIETLKKRREEHSHGISYEATETGVENAHKKCNNELREAEYFLLTGITNSSLASDLIVNTAITLMNSNDISKITERTDFKEFARAINSTLDMLLEMRPKDIFEAMLCLRMIGLHHLGQAEILKLNITTSMDYKNQHLARMVKTFKLWDGAKYCLDKHRRKEDQTVRVEHVHVYEGGKAIVGNLSSERGA